MSNNITVIIPIHKLEEHYLNGCIQSIKNQRVKPKQVLIVRSDDKELTKFLDSYDFEGSLDNKYCGVFVLYLKMCLEIQEFCIVV
jgi:tRNA(His) 5'-end guanylyltransferase